MHLNNQDVLQRLTAAKPFRKGASEAEMAVHIALRKTTAALAANVVNAKSKGISA